MNLKIKNYASIERADIDIEKINVVGGINTSGKTTASKLLYCHLKSEIHGQDMSHLLESEGLENSESVHFSSNEHLSEVFYVENISIIDLTNPDFLNADHIRHIINALENESKAESELIIKIKGIIESDCSTLSSAGIKQVGLILRLLENGSLKKNSFLIIDEPESNLHPEWQIRFAQILALLADELSICIYLNSHSPIFIEAMSLYSQYYDLMGQTRFYLTQKTSNGYAFKRINPKNMGEVYENLTSPYDELDSLKAKIMFRE